MEIYLLFRHNILRAATLSLFTLFLFLINLAGATPRTLTVRIQRWLAVRQLVGEVTYQQQRMTRPAEEGDRLQTVGDRIMTGKQSRAVLEVDTGIGFIQLGESSQINVRSLKMAPDSGRVSLLEVPYGQVRLQLRRFNHRGSRLELQTPAGVGAVRGTVFGMSVQPGGKTGMATLSGQVAMTAQGKTVVVPGGFQNFTIPGERPSPVVPLRNDTSLRYQVEQLIQGKVRQLRFHGQVDPVNAVLVGQSPQTTDRNGNFSLSLPAVSLQTLQVTVITPLGQKQVHQLSLRL